MGSVVQHTLPRTEDADERPVVNAAVAVLGPRWHLTQGAAALALREAAHELGVEVRDLSAFVVLSSIRDGALSA